YVPTGCGPIRVRDGARRRDQPGLLAVALRHRRSSAGEPLAQLALEPGIDRGLLTQRGSDRLACEVIFGRSEAAGAHDQVRPAERPLDRLAAPRQVVADGGDKEEVDAQAGEALREVLSVGVDDLSEQKLGTYGENLCAHASSSWHGNCSVCRDNLRNPNPSLPHHETPSKGGVLWY